MPLFKVTFFGSLLIEADGASWADVVAHGWTGAMTLATHGRGHDVPPEIRAVEFCIERTKISDVTQALQASIEKDAEKARQNPFGHMLAQKFCSQDRYVGLQAAWESFEFERMRPKGNNPDFG